MFELGMNWYFHVSDLWICGLVRCFWWEAPEHGSMIGFPNPKKPCFVAFLFIYLFLFHVSFILIQILPLVTCASKPPRCTNCYSFSILPSQFKGKTKKKKNPKKKRKSKLLAGLVCLLTVTPIACLLFGLHGSSWGMTCTDWVRIWLWVGCSRLALRMWVTQESEKVSLASLAARGICAMWWAQVDTLELHLQLDLH